MEQKSINTYKISFKKIARAAAAEVRVHKKLSIITLVLYGVAMMLFIFDADVYEVHNNVIYQATFVPSGWGIFFAVIGVIVGFFTVLNVFRDMNNQQLCDVSMALPIKASERFLSKVLSLFYIQIFPLFVSTFVGNGIAVLWGTAHFGSIDPDAVKTMFMIVLGCLAGSMFIMAIAVLCSCCCGALAESAYFSIMLMFVLNILPVFFVYYIIPVCAGFSTDWNFSEQIFDLGYFGLLFFISYDKIIPHCLVSSTISLVIMLLSGLIYIKRDARSVGKPIASKLFFEIIMALGCVTVFSVFAMSDYTFWGILISLVGYVIINIIVSRAKINVFSFLKWGGKYAATLAAFTVLLVVTIKTGGFGYINSRPAAEYLDGASFEIIYFDYTYESVNYVYRREDLETAVLTAEQADEVMSICKKYFVNGRANVNPFDIIFGKSHNVIVTAKSAKRYSFCPSPKNHFTYWYNDRQGYSLSYRQRLYLPDSDAKAMIEELSARGFVNTVTRDPEIIAPETQTQYN